MQSFGAILMFDPHFLCLTILVVFSMKTYRACTDMLSSENDDFKFLKPTRTSFKNSY